MREMTSPGISQWPGIGSRNPSESCFTLSSDSDSRYHPVSNGVSLRNSANHKMNAVKDLSNFLNPAARNELAPLTGGCCGVYKFLP